MSSPQIFSFIVQVAFEGDQLTILTQDIKTRQVAEFATWDELSKALQETCGADRTSSLTDKLRLRS